MIKTSSDLLTLLDGKPPAHLKTLESQSRMKKIVSENIALHVATSGPPTASTQRVKYVNEDANLHSAWDPIASSSEKPLYNHGE